MAMNQSSLLRFIDVATVHSCWFVIAGVQLKYISV